MDEQKNDFLEKLNIWLIKAGNISLRAFMWLFRYVQRLWAWYQSINFPKIPLTALQWILLFYVIFGFIYLWATPIFEASDEIWHFGMLEYIREEGALPEYDVSDPEHIYENNLESIYRQEGSQPPLYYAVMAALTAPIDISDAPRYRQENPHVRAGETGSWGNKNLVLHPVEGIPLSGTPLAVYFIRLLGIGMGAVTVIAVYHCGKLISPHRPVAGLVAAALTAFNPMFIFISASVNNDVLVIMLNSLVIWLALLTMKDGFELKRSLGIAVLLALATLTKLSALVLVIPIALGALWVARRQKDWRGLLILGGAMLIAWGAIAGWWYYRNVELYGELFGTGTMAAVAGIRPEPFGFETALAEFEGFRQSYWGVFGAFNIITSPLFYALADFVVFIAIFGVAFLVAQLLAIQDFSFARREITLILFLLGIVLIGIIAYFSWTAQTYASQGRLLFPFFAAISPLLAVGLVELTWWLLFLVTPPDRSFVRAGDAVPEPILRQVLRYPITFVGFLALVIPLSTIAPQYQAPAPITEGSIAAEVNRVYAQYDGLELVGYDVVDRRYYPGERVRITFYWRVVEQSQEDLSLAIALINPYGDVISRNTTSSFPGAGTLRTSTWEVGAIYADSYELELTRSIVNARYPFKVDVSWYLGETDNRIQAESSDGNPINVVLDVGAVTSSIVRVPSSNLATLPVEDPNSLLFNARLRMQKYRFDLFEESPDVFTVDVLWNTEANLDTDYIAMLHVYNDEGDLVTQYDFQPELPTRYWLYGEDFRLTYLVTPPEEGYAAGNYHVHLGWYEKAEPYMRLVLAASELEPPPSTLEIFSFTVDAEGNLVMPELEIEGEGTEEPSLQGAEEAPTPDAAEETQMPASEASEEATEAAEATEEMTEEPEVTIEAEATSEN